MILCTYNRCIYKGSAMAWRAYTPAEKAVRAAAPPASPEALRAMSGLEAMTALAAGQFRRPTILDRFEGDLVEVDNGRAVFVAEPGGDHLNPLGLVHGGVALTLIDSCCGCAAHTTLPAGVGYTTVETKVNFVRAITPETGPVFAEGRVVAQGRTIITTEGRITDAAGRLLAHGTSTLLVLSPK
jgi:uncharacterized protein (TIGR00369 family)